MSDVIAFDVARWKEKDFQRVVVDLAHTYGWWVYHNPNSRMSASGMPDLLMVREPEILFVELKTEKGRLRPAQEALLSKLKGCGEEVYVWRPRDLQDIKTRLSRKEELCHPSKGNL